MQTVENGENRAFKVLLGLKVGVCQCLDILVISPNLGTETHLGVLSHVLEETCNSAHALIKVVPFLQRI